MSTKTFFSRLFFSASLLFLAGLSFGQSGNLQWFKIGSDTVLYNVDDIYEVIDLDTRVALRFHKSTKTETATMTMAQFMARTCGQFVQVTVMPSGQERAFSKNFITTIRKDGNTGKAALYLTEFNRTQLTDETVSSIIANYTTCGSVYVEGGGGGSGVDTMYYTGGDLVLRTSEDTFSIAMTDETIEIGPTSLVMCGSAYAPGVMIRDVLEGIDDCLGSFEVQLHPAVTLMSGSNRALTLDTVNQVLDLNLDADDSYDNSLSGLTSISIQDAIDELAARSSVLDGPFLVFELDTTLTNESQLVADSTMYITTDGDTTTVGVASGGISIVHLNSLLRDSIFTANPAWLLDGNTVGGPGKFLGTIDSQRLYFKTDNEDRLWISDAEDRLYLGDSLYYGSMVFDTIDGLVFSTFRDVISPASDAIRFRIKADGGKTIFFEPLSIHEEYIEVGLGIKDNAGSLGNLGEVAAADGAGGWTWDTISTLPAADRAETLWYDGTEWIPDSTITNTGDSVSIIANSNLPFRVNNGTNNVFRVNNNAQVYLSDATKAPSLFPVLSTAATPSPGTGLGFMVYSNGTTETGYAPLAVTGVPIFATSGTTYNIYSLKNFTPTSGTGLHTNLYVAGTINQTGAASGTTRGIHIDHTLTNATAYRALEISTVGGTGIYQSSTSTINQLRGSTIIGALGTPQRTMHVSGTARITGSVGGATGLLGVNLSNGDVSHVILGDGFGISNDTATATVSVLGWTASDGTDSEQISGGETLTFVGVNGATVTFDTTTNTISFDGNGGGGGPAGENNIGLSLGNGYDVYKTKSDTTLIFRSIVAGGILSGTENDTTIILTATEVDGSVTNELQVVDTFDLSSGYLRISLSNEDSIHTVLLDSLLGWFANADTGDSYDLIAGDSVSFLGANGLVVDYDAATKTFTFDGGAYQLPPGVSTQTLRYDINDSLVANSVLVNDGSRIAVNTTTLSPYDIRTNADIQVNGVRVGAPVDSSNVIVGSGIPSAAGAINNTIVGDLAATALTSGDYNTVVGYRSAIGMTTGNSNTLLGMGSGEGVTSQTGITAVGYHSNYKTTGIRNTAVGYKTIAGATGDGSDNAAVGYEALMANTTGDYNTALGSYALTANTTGVNNIAIGYRALDATTTVSNNMAIGYYALHTITSGALNVAVGNEALYINTSSSANTAIGFRAGKNTANGGGSIFLGYQAGLNYTTQDSVLFIESSSDSIGLITGDFAANRVGINLAPASTGRTLDVNGEVRVRDLTTTTPTKIVGSDGNGVLSGIVIGDYLSLSGDTLNAAVVGGGALPPGVFPQTLRYDSNDSLVATSTLVNNGSRIAVNDTCLAPYDINTSTDILVGDMRVGRGNSSVATNTAVGVTALNAITSGSNNTAIGNQAGRVMTIGLYNSYVGSQAGYSQTSATGSTGVGYRALYSNTTSNYNTAIGAWAMADNNAGTHNVGVGYNALATSTNKSHSIGIGYNAGRNGGSYSISIGDEAGYNYTNDRVLLIENSSDSVALISGDFLNTRAGINLGPKSITRTLDVNGEMRVRDLTTTTPTAIIGTDANGVASRMKIGDGLSLSNDTLTANGAVTIYKVITGTGASELFKDGASLKLLIPSNSVWNAKVQLVAGTTTAGNGSGAVGDAMLGEYLVGIKNVAGTTSLFGNGVVTTTESRDVNMAGSTVSITADNTNDALAVSFTPPTSAGTTTVTSVKALIYLTKVTW